MLADASSFESAPPLLECRGIDVCVGSRTLVRGLDLHLGRGSVLAVLGPNGSGKSLSLHTPRSAPAQGRSAADLRAAPD